MALVAAAVLLTAGTGGLVGYVVARQVTPVTSKTVYCSSPPVASTKPAAGGALAEAAAAVIPSVVSLTATSADVVTSGSGVILRSDGLVLTNNHVIADVAVNGGSISVTLADGRTYPATVVGRSPGEDIALLRVEGVSNLRPAVLGSDARLAPGDSVLVIGNAFGEPDTVTSGIVSAMGRSACTIGPTPSKADQQLYGTRPWLPKQLTLNDLIQTDAPIAEGDSGGALVNALGEVVGICTAFEGGGASSAATGVGYAIEIDVAYRAAQRLLGYR